MATVEEGWSPEELARMSLGPGRGTLSETDGRAFMGLLDMCHFLVDQITQVHNFPDVEAASLLRGTDTQACQLLSGQMYSYWDAAPAGPGVFEMLCEWTAAQPGVGAASRSARELGMGSKGGRKKANSQYPLSAALHALAINECAQWPRRRKTGAFCFAGEDASGAALLADANLTKIYRVLGLSTSLGDMLRANGSGDPIGAVLILTLLPFMGAIVYDGTLRGGPPNLDAGFLAELQALGTAAQAADSSVLVKELPHVADAPLLGKRVLVSGLQAKPELNDKYGLASTFDEPTGRYCVVMEDGLGAFKLKPANLAKAPPRVGGARSSAETPTLTAKEQALQERLKALRSVDDMWGA